MVTRTRDIFTTVTTEGALLPPDLLQRIAEGDDDLGGLTPETYHVYGERLNEATNHAWNRLQGAWQVFKKARAGLAEDDIGTTATRERWLLPLFRELDYGRLETAPAVEFDGKSYAISHGWRNVPIHLLGCKVDLDTRTPRVAGAAIGSPHSIVQVFLNRSDDHLWGFLSNGLRLRVLRDNVSLTRQAYIEFDLEAMMEGEVYADFVLLYLLCHQSRVEAERPAEFWLERWMKAAREQGTRALDQLRDGVERAIMHLGGGFIEHPANMDLRDALKSGALDRQDYYRELLRLVYRLLFLFVAEDRDLLNDPESPEAARERYQVHYSTRRLRTIAEALKGTRHHDLYEGQRVAMKLLGGEMTGAASLGLPVLGSMLWRDEAMPHLVDCKLSNRALLDAVRAISTIEDPEIRRLRAVDFKNLGAEELGSVYESLLELHPQINVEARSFALATAGGHERKTTGSYYTPTSLINALLDSALDPVLDEAVSKPTQGERMQAILDLKVCDPACGSGHFLIAAANRMARRLASVRTGEDEPPPEAVRDARRDIIAGCIYGVDLNEMAVELCKVNLWLESMVPGKPLSFLDHRIRHGNSLLGATPALMARGIPTDAIQVIEGDDRKTVSALRKQNRAELEQREAGVTQLDMFSAPPVDHAALARGIDEIDRIGGDTLERVHRQEQRYKALANDPEYVKGKLLADAWCAAFVWRRAADVDVKQPTDRIYRLLERDPVAREFEGLRREVVRLAARYDFFHWHIAYPDVFAVPREVNDKTVTGWDGGFDVVLGNPPWERIKIQEKEWFAGQHDEIANAPRASVRRKLIQALKDSDDPTDRQLYADFQEDKRKAEGESHFTRNSGYYPLCGRGDINTYSIFAELDRNLVSGAGRVGVVVPSGIATDATTQYFFNDLMESRSLASLYDFENRKGLFPAVDSRMKFALVTLTGPVRPAAGGAEFVFFAHDVVDLDEDERRFTLSAEEIALINPNTGTMATFRSKRDAKLTKFLYQVPVLADEAKEVNTWHVTYRQGLFHSSGDSSIFEEELNTHNLLPLYDGRMIWLYDHRSSSVGISKKASLRTSISIDTTREQYSDPFFEVVPRYWIPENEVTARVQDIWLRHWFVAFKDITSATNERTAVFSIIPWSGPSDRLGLLFFSQAIESQSLVCFVSNANSFAFDFSVRQKVGGTHLKKYMLEQLPIFPPGTYTPDLLAFVVPRVLELSYTAWDLQAFARDVGYEGPPFIWDDARRFWLRAELDALYFHLYSITRDDVDYIMETFPIVKRKDEAAHGSYRTKEAILAVYDDMAALGVSENAGRVAGYASRLRPGPASPEVAHKANQEA